MGNGLSDLGACNLRKGSRNRTDIATERQPGKVNVIGSR